VRAERAAAEVDALLRASHAAAIEHFDALVREEAAATGLGAAVVEDYLRHALHYDLEGGDLEGLRLFYALAAEDGLIAEARPLAFSVPP
jgi:predicted solute-binding protein